MLRLVVLCAVAVSLTSVFVAPLGGIEHTTRATPRVALHAKEASDGKHGNTSQPMMAILVGLALGDLTGKIFRFFHQKRHSLNLSFLLLSFLGKKNPYSSDLTFLRTNWGTSMKFPVFFGSFLNDLNHMGTLLIRICSIH